MNWKRAYTIGFHPWEDAVDEPAFEKKFLNCLTGRKKDGNHPMARHSICVQAVEFGDRAGKTWLAGYRGRDRKESTRTCTKPY